MAFARSRRRYLLIATAITAGSATACESIIGADFDRNGTPNDASVTDDATAIDGAVTIDGAVDGGTINDASAANDGSNTNGSVDASMCTGALCVVGTTALSPYAITIADGVLYFTARSSDPDASTGEVIRVALDGGAQTTIVSGLRAPQEIVVNAGYVYFVSHDSPQKVDGYGSIGQVYLDGGSPAVAVQGIDDSVQGLALYEGNLVWAAPNLGLVYEQLPADGTIHIIESAYALGGLSADAYGVYISSSEFGDESFPALVNVIDIGGGGLDTRQTTLYSFEDPVILGAVATDNANLIYAELLEGTVNVTDKKYGGEPKIIASNQDALSGVIADGAGHVYFITEGTADAGYSDGTVMRTSIDGGAATPIATSQHNPVSIALDGTRVYWANAGNGTGNGSIMSAPH